MNNHHLLKKLLPSFLESGALIAIDQKTVRLGVGERETFSNPQPGKNFFYFPDYFLKDKEPWFSYPQELEIEKERLLQILLEESEPEQNVPPFSDWSVQGFSIFHTAFGELHRLFDAGHLQKAVPFVFAEMTASFTKKRLLHCLINALNYAIINPLFIYGFWDRKEGLLGLTPELLFSLKGKTLHTMACAGTMPKNFRDLILQDPKMIHEHSLVVEGIEDSLKAFGKVFKGNMDILSLPSLCHLVTPIHVELSSLIEITELVASLHPTPALGAFPKKEGMLWLLNYEEKIPRGRFGAPVGYFSAQGEMLAYVAIRNVLWNSTLMKIGAGCGVVKGSELDKEWGEIELKIKSVRCMLGL